jgi:uncharacterized surface protein with fasciclin (FAS1) repeats
MKKMNVLSLLMIIITIPSSCFGFQLSQTSIATSIASPSSAATTTTRLHSSLDGILNKNEDLLTVKKYLHENYPALSKIVNLNDSIWKALGEGEGFTIFAPNTAAFASLGDTKQEQLLDERNVETTQKIAAYHVIAEVVTADDLFNSGGVLTLGGEIPVDRSVSGGMFGVGGKEDGGVLVNTAQIITSIELGSGVLHEVDGLVAPNILWRYMDQLRIPGSK